MEVNGDSNDIPLDILLQIFHKLPVKSLIRFSCVSKLWFYLINNDQQQFHKFHMVESQKQPTLISTFQDTYKKKRFYYVENEEHGNTSNAELIAYQKDNGYRGLEYMMGYCNGLGCYWNYGVRRESYNGEWVYFSLEICNPSRIEKLIIVSRFKSRVDEQICGFRIGYNQLSDEYKVMCIMKYEDEYEYYIFTLGSTNPWRKINNPWPKQRPTNCFPSSSRRRVPPIFCNGTLFYEAVKNEAEEEKYKRFTLVSFDFQGEKFQMIRLPSDDEFVTIFNNGGFSQLEYEGCFCYSSMEKFDPYRGKVVLCILKDTVQHVWVKKTIKFVLPKELDNHALPASAGIVIFFNQVILYWRLHEKQQDCHAIYNLHSNKLKEVQIPNECYGNDYEYCISSHAENFLSLKHFATKTGEGNTREVLEEYKKTSYLKREHFNDMPTSDPAVISFLDPL
ncbi:F-box protein At1g47810-like [Papaver somniferum]|uniref:F-box protein At1g47810-like n=1 Tax=Papaver somniferum TaxID=3469 RepID=UPI000E6FF3C9|nr:F-box protein At1g47810-like [Papaver somniferum]